MRKRKPNKSADRFGLHTIFADNKSVAKVGGKNANHLPFEVKALSERGRFCRELKMFCKKMTQQRRCISSKESKRSVNYSAQCAMMDVRTSPKRWMNLKIVALCFNFFSTQIFGLAGPTF